MSATPAPARPLDRAAARLVTLSMLPDRVVVGTVAIAAAAATTVSLGIHRPWFTLPLAVVFAVVGWRLQRSPQRATSAQARGAVIAIIGVLVWLVLNAALASEYLIVVRDPGFLTLSGEWLTHHPSTDIPAGTALAAADLSQYYLADAEQAWNLRGDQIQPQGAKLLPAMLAIGGWFAGTDGVLVTNLVIGAACLVAFYAVARLAMGPIAALAPAATLSLTASHLVLSRSAYSETITTFLLLAALLLAWRGLEQRSGPLLIASGMASGLITFARIDGAVYAVGLLVGVTLAIAMTSPWAPGSRRRIALGHAAAQVGMVVAGYASTWRWSQKYVERLLDQTQTLAALYGAAIIVTVVLIGGFMSTGTARQARWSWWQRYGPSAAAAGMAALWLGLAARPLFWTSHGFEGDDFHTRVVESFQARAGLPVDGTRDYTENTVTWMSYYLGWPLLVVGIAGFAFAAYRAAQGSARWAALTSTFLVPSLIYLVRPSIVPDQIWAIRRLAPSALTGLILLAAVVSWELLRRLSLRRSTGVDRVALAAAALLVVSPVAAWFTVSWGDDEPVQLSSAVWVQEQGGAREQVDQLCATIDGRPVALVGSSSYFGALRVMCDVPVVLVLSPHVSAPDMVALRDQLGDDALVVTRATDRISLASTPEAPTISGGYEQMPYELLGLPRGRAYSAQEWYLGTIDESGLVVPLPARSVPVVTVP